MHFHTLKTSISVVLGIPAALGEALRHPEITPQASRSKWGAVCQGPGSLPATPRPDTLGEA